MCFKIELVILFDCSCAVVAVPVLEKSDFSTDSTQKKKLVVVVCNCASVPTTRYTCTMYLYITVYQAQ